MTLRAQSTLTLLLGRRARSGACPLKLLPRSWQLGAVVLRIASDREGE
jgi:hypothetical protein